MRKHILVISQYFYPEQFRINDICKEWINRGYQVTVITGIPNYPQGRYYANYGLFKKRKEQHEGINIIRLPLIPRGHSPLMLALNYLSFVISGFFWSHFTSIKADTVFIFEVSPMTQALPGVWYAKRRKIPCNLYVQDLWPENVEIITGLKNKLILGAIGKMVDSIYRRCNRIFTTSESFVTAIAKRGVPETKIEFWPQYAEGYEQAAEKAIIAEIPNDGRFNIIFAGNIGFAQGLEILPKTANLLKQSEVPVRFNFVGDGRFKNEFIRIVHDKGVEAWFNFIDRQPAGRIPELLAANDAAFLSLSANPLFSMTIPAKLQTYLAFGIPVIASADGETQRILKEAGAGFCSPAGDPEKLAEIIRMMAAESPDQLRQMAANARAYSQLNFNKETLLDRMDEHFNNRKMERETNV